jgi:hypothetical protein
MQIWDTANLNNMLGYLSQGKIFVTFCTNCKWLPKINKKRLDEVRDKTDIPENTALTPRNCAALVLLDFHDIKKRFI